MPARTAVSLARAPLWLPTDLGSQLEAWYDAELSCTGLVTSGAIAQCADLGANARHLAQATGANQPLLIPNIINGHPVMRFDGSNDRLSVAAFYTGTTFTLIAVLIARASATAKFAICNGPSTAGFGLYTGDVGGRSIGYPGVSASEDGAVSVGTAEIWTAVHSGAGVNAFYLNGASQSITNSTANPAAPSGTFNLGSGGDPNAWAQFDIAAVILANVGLSAANLSLLHKYLANRYAITLG